MLDNLRNLLADSQFCSIVRCLRRPIPSMERVSQLRVDCLNCSRCVSSRTVSPLSLSFFFNRYCTVLDPFFSDSRKFREIFRKNCPECFYLAFRTSMIRWIYVNIRLDDLHRYKFYNYKHIESIKYIFIKTYFFKASVLRVLLRSFDMAIFPASHNLFKFTTHSLFMQSCFRA